MNRLLGRSQEGCHFNCQVCGGVDLCSRRDANSPRLYFKIFIQPNCIRDEWKSDLLWRDKDILLTVAISSLVNDDHLAFVS